MPSDGAIRYSLAAVKNVGRHAVEHLCEERAARGPFRDVSDFARRINPRLLNKRALETLAAAGALDELGIDRATALANVDRHHRRRQPLARDESRRPGRSLRRRDARAAADRAPPRQAFGADRPAVARVRGGRLLPHRPSARRLSRTCSKRSAPRPGSTSPPRPARAAWSARLPARCCHARERQGKTGNAYAFVAFSDPTGQFEAVVFSEALAASRALLEPGSAVLLDVEAEADGETVKVRVQRIVSLETAAEARHAGMKIYLDDTRALDPARRAGRGRGGPGPVPPRAPPRRCSRARSSSCCRKASTPRPKQRSALKLVDGVAAISAL